MKNIVSLFDGISCARVALDGLGYKDVAYYASEIDKYAMEISKKNWPDIRYLGDVKLIGGVGSNSKQIVTNKVDLLIGGSPCQDLSIAKKNRDGLAGKRSGLFYEFLRIRDEMKPKYFILENVASMSEDARNTISKELGVEPVMINAALVSAQNRKRLFWVGKYSPKIDKYEQVNIPLPEDRGILLKDILMSGESEDMKSLCITATYYKKTVADFLEKRMGQMVKESYIQCDINNKGHKSQDQRIYFTDNKMATLPSNGTESKIKILVQRPRGKNKGGAHKDKSPTLTSNSFEQNNHIVDGFIIRKLHPIECERLQCLPDNYTQGISNTQRYKSLGNAFNVEVVRHIISYLDL